MTDDEERALGEAIGRSVAASIERRFEHFEHDRLLDKAEYARMFGAIQARLEAIERQLSTPAISVTNTQHQKVRQSVVSTIRSQLQAASIHCVFMVLAIAITIREQHKIREAIEARYQHELRIGAKAAAIARAEKHIENMKVHQDLRYPIKDQTNAK